MTRGFPARPVLSAALVLMLLASIGLTSFVAPTSATPSPETARNAAGISNSITSPADEGPSPRFPFSVLNQASTATPTVTPTATRTATPTATPPGIPGDYNRDGFVDIRDYGVWRQNFGQTNC